MMNKNLSVKIYHGYGHTHNLVLYGHVFKFKAKTKQVFSPNFLVNMVHLLKLFMVKPYPFAQVRLHFKGQVIYQKAAYDGFFKFEWQAQENIPAGWHPVRVEAVDDADKVWARADGEVFVPHITQYAFISDIDDTVMISHSAKLGRRLKELFTRNPRTRKTFAMAQTHYQLLANAHTEAMQPNPFFYVSSSEWNLYDYLVETFRFNKLPEGAFLLNQLKQWKSFFKTGKTGHEGKLLRVMRIIDAFPKQRFVFLGDNSQQDPVIYHTIAMRFPQNVAAVYIRNIRPKKREETLRLLNELEQNHIHTCLFTDSEQAIGHSKKIGLIA